MQLNEEKMNDLSAQCEECECKISLNKFLENYLKGIALEETKEYHKRAPRHKHEEKRNRSRHKQCTRLDNYTNMVHNIN